MLLFFVSSIRRFWWWWPCLMHAIVGLITQVWGTWTFRPKNTIAEQILERRSSGTANNESGGLICFKWTRIDLLELWLIKNFVVSATRKLGAVNFFILILFTFKNNERNKNTNKYNHVLHFISLLHKIKFFVLKFF